jgi:hypothetical protein
MPTWNTGGCGPREKINVFRQLGENMAAPKREIGLKEISGKPEDPGKSPRTKLGIFGE